MADNCIGNDFIKSGDAELHIPKNFLVSDYGYGVRHVQIGILFFSIVCGCAASSCLSVVILAMTDKEIHGDAIQTFDWDSQTKGIILSASVWGDIPFQIAGSLLVQKIGAKRIVSFIMFATGTLSILTPYSSHKLGWMGICTNRFLQGLSQTFTFSCIHTLIGNWVPISERNRFGNFVYSGVYVSTVTTMPLTAFIATSFLGWPWVFYFFGGCSIFCGFLWTVFGAESPAHHKTITPEERNFIQTSLGNEDILKMKLKTPWRAMATSASVWVLIATQTGAVWGFTIMIMETPTFLKMALGLNLQNIGLIAALPYAITWFIIQITSVVADYLVNRGHLTITGVRKLMNTLGTWGPGLFLLILPFIPTSNIILSVAVIVLIISLDGISAVGFLLNHIDLSPNFAGVLVSFANTAASSVCFLAPILSGYILQDPTDIEQWKLIFFITAAFYILGNCAFLLYGSGEIQPFNNSYLLQDSNDGEKLEVEEKELVPLKTMTKEILK